MTDKIRLATSLPHEYLDAIGAISVNFGAVENSLSLGIWMLLGGPGVENEEKYQIVTAQLSAKNLVWMFTSLYGQRFGINDELEKLKKRIFSAEEKRNTLLHSLWVEGEKQTAQRLKLIARGEYKLTSTDHTKDELVAVASELAQLAYDITQFTLQSFFPDERT